MLIIVEFVKHDRVTRIIDTNKLEFTLKDDVEEKVKKNPYINFPDEYFDKLKKGIIDHPVVFPTMIDGHTMVYFD
jgi:hypothetical protein